MKIMMKNKLSINKKVGTKMNKVRKSTKNCKGNIMLCFHLFVLTVFYLCTTLGSALAQVEFQGSLNRVTITDVGGTNAPPVANFQYTIEGSLVSLDASTSSDPDGDIVDYKWDFGGVQKATGVSVTYDMNEEAQVVTLTVIDDLGALSIIQSVINLQTLVADDFGIDSTGDYTPFDASVTVQNGVLRGQIYRDVTAYHNTPLGSSNQRVSADVMFSGSASTGVVFRVNPQNKTMYSTLFDNQGRLQLFRYDGTSWLFVGINQGPYEENTVYNIEATIQDKDILISVDGNQAISVTDESNLVGEFCGIRIKSGSSVADVHTDNFSGEGL